MSAPTEKSSTEASPASPLPQKKRSILGKILLWGVIGALIFFLVMETSSCLLYMSTLSGLDDAMGAKGISVDDVARHVKGIAFRTEEPKSPNGSRKLVYRWPSLIAKYQINVLVNDQKLALRASAEDLTFAGDPSGNAPALDNQISASSAPNGGLLKLPKPIPGFPYEQDRRVTLAAREFGNLHMMMRRRLGSLARELMRQSVLIAARDEMGLSTGDELLGELQLVTESPKSYPLEADIVAIPNGSDTTTALVSIRLTRPNPSGSPFEWTSSQVTVPITPGLEDLAEQLETLSRGSLIEGLKAAGYEPARTETGEPLKVPEEMIPHMDIVSQFAVIRHHHSERRMNGETPGNLAGLARAYANLGNMIEFHWGPMTKVYKARALLYSQRLLAKFGKTAESLATRSYVWTLIGNYKLALEDAAAARALDEKSIPAWLKLTEAQCLHTPDVFDEPAEDKDELAAYLRMRTLAPAYEMDRCVAATTAMLYINPACSRAIEKMYQTRELGMGRSASEGGANVSWHAIHGRLCEIPGVPEPVLEIARQHTIKEGGEQTSSEDQEQTGRVEIIKHLREIAADDSAGQELSWFALARMLEDLTFIQSVRTLEVQSHWLGLPRDQVALQVDSMLTLIDKHPFRSYLITFKEDRPALLPPTTEMVETTNPTFYEMNCLPLTQPATWANQDYYKRLMESINGHWDKIYYDLIETLNSRETFMTDEAWNHLMEVAPHQPAVVSRKLSQEQNFDEKIGKEWEEKYQNSSQMQLEIGKKYKNYSRSDDAIRCFQKSIDLQPTHEAYQLLAYEFSQHDELERSLETYEESLSLESYGLESAETHSWMADILMQQGKWAAAMVHAEEAASSYSGWGLLKASRCAEGLKNWEQAENYCRLSSERYLDSSGEDWYMWCLRTGKGNIRLAKVLADRYWRELPRPQFTPVRWNESISKIVDGNLEKAIEILMEPIDNGYENTFQWVLAGLLADKLGDTKRRDSIFYAASIHKSQLALTSARLASLFILSLKNPEKVEWNEHSFLELVDSQGTYADVPYLYFCAGMFLGLHGEEELSLRYLQCAATNSYVDDACSCCLLANLALREKKIPVGETRLKVHPDDRAEGIHLMHKAVLARRERRFADAHRHLAKSMELIPNFTAGLLERARLKLVEGKPEEAIKDYEEILKINPESQYAHLYLAQVLAICDQEQVRNGKLALEHMKAVSKLRPGSYLWCIWLLAASYAESGEFDKAIEEIELAARLDPKDKDYPKMLELYRQKKCYYLPPDKLP